MSFGFEITLILFSLVSVIVLATRGLYGFNPKSAIVICLLLVAWLSVVFSLALKSAFSPPKPSPIPLAAGVMIPVILGTIALYRLPKFKNLLFSLSQQSLIQIHVSRILGAIFLWYYVENRLPGIFALSAGLGDCLVAISAPFVVWAIDHKKSYAPTVFKVFHFVGIVDFTAALTLGALSSEGPQRLIFQEVPSNAIASLPLVLIPTFGVPLIVLAHLISILKFKEARKNNPDSMFV
ncbi:hypothetical protein A0128_19910 [Leptospira tipperaryensis]|uniref:Uncharacterized protein n=1 Tax=Leptospira tipperaryensis TaxID=2564040 RepID=A0A1D7V384_9LEPT|nr:hypothetical protein [Leptospira tipperaryensis]AOP36290.1 hypothetical protein A0128_19910 [Leptospira tipperaryensis]